MMADISKIRISNSVVPNLVMNVDHNLQLRPHKKFGPHRLYSQRVLAV